MIAVSDWKLSQQPVSLAKLMDLTTLSAFANDFATGVSNIALFKAQYSAWLKVSH